MNSFDILKKEIDLVPRLFLEASAGTGKTFTIEHLVVRLLLESSWTIDQLLVVTFTKAATRELKERIRTNLENVVVGEAPFEYLDGLSENQRGKILTALQTFDQAQIFTIHGFCRRLLQEFAFEASIGLELKEWTPEEERWAILEFLRTTQIISPQQMRRLLKGDLEALIKRLQKGTKETGDAFLVLLDKLNKELADLPVFSIAEVFSQIRSEYKQMTSNSFETQAHLLDRRKLTAEEFDQLIGEEEVFLEGIETGNLKVKAKITGHPLMEEVRSHLWPILEAARDRRKIFKTLCQSWLAEKKKNSRMHERATSDDFLQLVQEKLTDASFIERVRKKYQVVIVDEFQDTDPVQWNIFETLFFDDPTKSIYVVGDPKQAIYAFRNADIYTFLEAGKRFDQKAVLTTNFRSGKQLIDALNRLFCEKSWLDLPKLGQTVQVVPVQAYKQKESDLYFMQVAAGLGRGKQWPSVEVETSYFFPFIVHEIGRLKLDPSEIAILVKDRYQASRAKEYLEKWNIPCSIARASALSHSLALELLEELIEACQGIDRLSAMKKVMVGPLMQMSLDQLTDEAIFQVKREFDELAKLWLEDGFARFFAAFIRSRPAVIQASYGSDLMEIVEKLIFLNDPEQVMKAVQELKISEDKDRISVHPHGVQIMTIHASKGLEFETVFALGLASRTKVEDADHLSEMDAEKMRQLYVAMTRAKSRLYVPLLKEIEEKPVMIGEASPIELFLQRTEPKLDEFNVIDLNRTEFILAPLPLPDSRVSASMPREGFFKPIYLQSFSSLASVVIEKPATKDERLPPGAETGIIIHAIFEKYFEERRPLDELIAQEVRATHLESYQPNIFQMISDVLDLSLGDFSLRDIENSFPEMEFLFPENDALLKGFIDLCFEWKGKYYFIDWKTNVLEDYTSSTVAKAMEDHDYLLQGEIYSKALRRFLKLYGDLPFGGGYFIFVRGPAFYHLEDLHE